MCVTHQSQCAEQRGQRRKLDADQLIVRTARTQVDEQAAKAAAKVNDAQRVSRIGRR